MRTEQKKNVDGLEQASRKTQHHNNNMERLALHQLKVLQWS